jgi:ABC-type antimicrobial peptide transport system permease subunit
LQQQIELSFDRERAIAVLAELFGIVALVLAALGIYGVTIYMVAQQTNEIGIRMALGADRARVMRMVLRVAFQRVAIGLVVGLPLTVAAARFMAAQLYGVKFWDPFALTIGAGALAVSAFVAAILPALRAAAISPMRALRAE